MLLGTCRCCWCYEVLRLERATKVEIYLHVRAQIPIKSRDLVTLLPTIASHYITKLGFHPD